MRRRQAVLERAVAEQEVDDVSFVRLQPVQRTSWYWSYVQAIDMPSIYEFSDPFFTVSDRRANKGRSNLAEHLILRTLHHRYKRKHVLGIRHAVVAVGDMQHCGTQIVTTFVPDQTVAAPVLRRNFCDWSFDTVVDLIVHRFRNAWRGERGNRRV